MGEIAIVALDLNRESDGYQQFAAAPFEKQLDLIANRIAAVCDDLKQKEPNSMWLVTWREYGLTDGFERSLSSEQKKTFKSKMKQLVEQFHPNLTIVAGTIATKKKVNKKDKLKKIVEYYETHAWIKEKESKLDVKQHHMMKENEKIKTLEAQEDLVNFYAVRNTCYVFTSADDEEMEEKVKIWRHDKVAPFDETHTTTDREKIEIFQPGKGRNLSPLCYLRHPITQELVPIGVEICREHDFANLGHSKGQNNALLHLIMSDSIGIKLNKLDGEYIMPLDSKFKARMFTKKNNLNNLPIRWYQTDMCAQDYALSGPLDITYPFEMRVFDLLNETISKLPRQGHNQMVLNKILGEFYDAVYQNKGQQVDAIYDALEKALQKYVKELQFESSNTPTLIFTAAPRMDTLINSLYQLLRDEREKKLMSCDFLGKTEAQLSDKRKVFMMAIDQFDVSTALACIRNFDILNGLKLNMTQAYMLIQMLYTDSMPENDQTFYFKKIFDNSYPLLKVIDDGLEGKSLLHVLCEMNRHEALKIALPAYKNQLNDVFPDGNTILAYAIAVGADEKTLEILQENGAIKKKDVTPPQTPSVYK